MAMANPLERIQEQRAQRLLDALQSDLRAQMRSETSAAGGRSGSAQENARARMKKRLAKLVDPAYRERVWSATALVPEYDGQQVRSLPKARSYWERVDVSEWNKKALDAACLLLDLETGGKKSGLVARIQDWVHEPELRARREQQALLDKQRNTVLASGRVFAFGNNFSGELGLGHRRSCETPSEIESLQGCRIQRVLSGFDANFAFAFGSDGRMFGWGGGGKALFDSTSGGAQRQQELDAQHDATPAADSSELGDATGAAAFSNAPLSASAPAACFLYPREIAQLQMQQRIADLACARTDGHIGFTTDTGRCYMWGRGDYGELGVDKQASVSSAAITTATATHSRDGVAGPVHVESLQSLKVRQVSVGNCHSAAVTSRGALYTWGGCWSGQLGLGESKRAGVKEKRQQLFFPSPTLVEAFHSSKLQIAKVSCGAVHTAAISRDGRLFTFGCGDGGRLGLGADGGDVLHPELVESLARDFVVDVCCGSWHSLCLVRMQEKKRADVRRDTDLREEEDAPSGYVYAFGSGLQGQLGLGKQKIAAMPNLYHRKVQCKAIALSSHHSAALSTDGNLFTWGQNTSGCLGRRTLDGAIDSAEPDLVQLGQHDFGVGPIVSIAAGDRFTLFATGPWEPKQEQEKAHFSFQEKLNRHSKFQS